MSGLYVYALVGGARDESLGGGLAGEPLRRLGQGPVWAIAGELPEPPRPDPESLKAHDATVRRLAAQASRLLPARFGQFLPDQKALDSWLAAHARDLAAALDQVAGCVQMTLRVFAGSDLPEAPPELEAPAPAVEGGPGARYLELRRRDVARQHALPEIAPLREALRPLLRGERIERAYAPGRLRATAYDLIAGGAVAEYSRIVSDTAPSLPAWRITASGPWPPYAFAPRAVA